MLLMIVNWSFLGFWSTIELEKRAKNSIHNFTQKFLLQVMVCNSGFPKLQAVKTFRLFSLTFLTFLKCIKWKNYTGLMRVRARAWKLWMVVQIKKFKIPNYVVKIMFFWRSLLHRNLFIQLWVNFHFYVLNPAFFEILMFFLLHNTTTVIYIFRIFSSSLILIRSYLHVRLSDFLPLKFSLYFLFFALSFFSSFLNITFNTANLIHEIYRIRQLSMHNALILVFRRYE